MATIKNITGGMMALAIFMAIRSPAIAQNEMTAPAPASNENVETANAGSVPIFSGGVGDDEMDYIKSIQHQYDVKLLFTANTGEYLSEMNVTVTNKQGHVVVNTVTAGPVLLLNLPSGTYTVQASQGALSHEEKISVKNGGLHTYQLRFAAPDVVSVK